MIRQVNICGIPHTIEYEEDAFNVDTTHFGQIDYVKCQITLNSTMTQQMTNVTLWHEGLHGILLNLGYEQLCHDEQFVQALATALNQFATIKDISPETKCCSDGTQKTF